MNTGYSARKLSEEFPDKDWSCSALDRLLRQIDAATGPADRKSISSREPVRSAQETCKCLCKWWPLWAQTVTGGIAYELLRRLFHIGNFCFWALFYKQLLLKNCAVDFVEICNLCNRKVIIKAAKRIFNSDKICCSYYDFYFGVTFLEHTVYTNRRFATSLQCSEKLATCVGSFATRRLRFACDLRRYKNLFWLTDWIYHGISSDDKPSLAFIERVYIAAREIPLLHEVVWFKLTVLLQRKLKNASIPYRQL